MTFLGHHVIGVFHYGWHDSSNNMIYYINEFHTIDQKYQPIDSSEYQYSLDTVKLFGASHYSNKKYNIHRIYTVSVDQTYSDRTMKGCHRPRLHIHKENLSMQFKWINWDAMTKHVTLERLPQILLISYKWEKNNRAINTCAPPSDNTQC